MCYARVASYTVGTVAKKNKASKCVYVCLINISLVACMHACHRRFFFFFPTAGLTYEPVSTYICAEAC